MNFIYDVTVIIPVYNTEVFIEECVESIMNQKMDVSRIEVLLVNDGSSDNSGDVCEKIAKKYENVTYIYKENSGVSDTRNIGIQRAQGKYIMLLDSDDYIGDKTIKCLIEFFNHHYDEIDLVTYPIFWDREGKISLHNRYSKKKYNKGTGIYDLDEYPYLNQSTVNIMFKNELGNNLLYDVTMKLSEDQNFNTSLLMKKNKIGFVKKGEYFYRRHGASVSQTRNNPYYCFDDIMTYNEGLLSRFVKDGKIPKYLQTLVINTLGWRVKQDELLPYHYSEEDFCKAKERILNLLKKIDDDVIVNFASVDVYVKLYFLQWKKSKFDTILTKEGYNISLPSGTEIAQGTDIDCYIYRTKFDQEEIEVFGSFSSPILQIFPVNQYIVEGKTRDGKLFVEHYPLEESRVPFRNTKMKTAKAYPFTYRFDPKKIKTFKLYLKVNGIKMPMNVLYIRFCGFIRKFMRNSVPLNNYRLSYHRHRVKLFKVTKRNIINDLKQEIISIPFYPLKRLPGILYYRQLAKSKRKIWLYSDSAGVVDNAFYQFVHDFDKNDGIERYYIVDGDDQYLKDKLTSEQKKYIVKHRSKKHKELFMQAEKILISFSSFSIYSPFKNLSWYMDILHFDLIYLQHGILHASLQKMYGKEFTQIDKFVISSVFEKNNLIHNYDYSPHDLILSGMPRMEIKQEDAKAKNKILLAPSWRQYLIGYMVNNRRELKDEEFLQSDFFNEINQFLHSKELEELLNTYHLELDFKLHPIFKEYRKHFRIDNVPNVDINFDKIILGEYKMFITDFSSFQFDFVKFNRPIIYFLPDEKEFKAGLHSYKTLDLEYKDAFGKLCLTSSELLSEMKKIIDSQFQVSEPYQTRMATFFTIDEHPCEKIYSELMKSN